MWSLLVWSLLVPQLPLPRPRVEQHFVPLIIREGQAQPPLLLQAQVQRLQCPHGRGTVQLPLLPLFLLLLLLLLLSLLLLPLFLLLLLLPSLLLLPPPLLLLFLLLQHHLSNLRHQGQGYRRADRWNPECVAK